MQLTIHDDTDMPLYLDVILDSLETIKSQQYVTLLMSWNHLFKDIDVKIHIHIPDSQFRITDHSHFIIHCEPESYFESLQVVQNKNVYGTNYSIITTRLVLRTKENIILIRKQISHNSLKKIYVKALKIQYQKFTKNLENTLTSEQSFGIF